MRDYFFKRAMTDLSMPFLLAAAFVLLAACSDNTLTGTTKTTATGATVAAIQIAGLPTTVKSDNSNTSTITVMAVNGSNATMSGVTINLSTDTGLLSTSKVITDSTGKATATFSSGTASKANRTATITATAGTTTAMLPIQIVGSTLTLTTFGSTSLLSGGGSSATLTIIAKDAGGGAIAGASVLLTQTGAGTVTFSPSTLTPSCITLPCTTDANGQLNVTVAGATAGIATVTVNAVGATATKDFTVSATTTTFGINLLTLTSGGIVGAGVVPVSPKTAAMKIGDSLAVQVSAPSSTQVIFSTTIGIWFGASPLTPNVITVPVAAGIAGIATATLNTATAGQANVQVLDISGAPSDTLTVGMTAKTPAKISLQASPTVVPKSVGSTVGFSNLTAIVLDANNLPVGGAPVAFSIVTGTGTSSGESVSPVVVFTATTTTGGLALGAAPTTFTSGSLSSGAAGVQVRASVVGTTITTQPLYLANGSPAPNLSNPPSSYDAGIVVGGSAGSVAFGQATTITDLGPSSTIYVFPMSVLVADSNGSPAPLGTVVNISVWPIAWSTGWGCSWDPDGKVFDAATRTYVAGDGGTFYNEDVNQNLFLDAGEDGTRKYFATGTVAPVTGTSSITPSIKGNPSLVYTNPAILPTKDGQITPLNSYGGTLASTNLADKPGTATTDASGVAAFNLTYTKSMANWIVSRIHASTMVQGSPAVGQLDFRLLPTAADSVPCVLPPSPFKF